MLMDADQIAACPHGRRVPLLAQRVVLCGARGAPAVSVNIRACRGGSWATDSFVATTRTTAGAVANLN